MSQPFYHLEQQSGVWILRLNSSDHTNRLTRDCVTALYTALQKIGENAKPLIITGNQQFFSVGADLEEIAMLNGPDAYEFSKMGQALMTAVEQFPAPVHAAVSGYCMGGGLDLALSCHHRVAAPNAIFGHRGAALGLITGWGGTQRLPRLVGKAVALEIFVAAEKIDAHRALALGLAETVADDPVAETLRQITTGRAPNVGRHDGAV